MNQDGGTWWRSPGWPIPAWIHGNAPYLANHAGLKVSEMLCPNVPPMEMRAPGPRQGLGFIVTSPGTSQQINGGGYTSAGGGPVIMPQAYSAPLPLTGSTPAGTPVTAPLAPPKMPTGGGGIAPVQPIWFDTNNNIITSAVCGSIYSMTLPGYEGKTVYVIQTKNGAQQFAGSMAIPMSNYASKCNQDEGYYQLSAYEPTSGNLIGQGSFTVLPAGTASTAASSTGTTGATVPAATPGMVPTAPAPAAAVGMTATVPAPAPTTTTSVLSNLSGVDWILIGAVVVALLNRK